MHDEPIRILHIVICMARAGLETMIMNYYRCMDRNKIQFDFLEHRKEVTEYDKEIEALGGKIFRLPAVNPLSVNYRRQLNLFFKEHKEYRIVHCHMNFMSGLPITYARKNGIPIAIAHIHSTNVERNLKYPIKLYYKYKMLKNATDYFACGETAGNWAFNGKQYTIMRNAIDINKFRFDNEKRKTIRKNLKLTNEMVIGHVGRFSFPKNHFFIIDIFKHIVEKDKHFILLLVGDGTLKEKIEHKVIKEGLDKNVIFYGTTGRVEEVMSAMDLFMLPSLYEGLPVTLIEAQYSGLRCFISDKVPQESIVVDNVFQLGLNLTAEEWAETILDKSDYQRENVILEDKRFDICKSARWLEEKYRSMLTALKEKEEIDCD